MLAYTLFFVLAFFSVSKFYFKRRYDVIQFHTLPDFIVFVGIIPKICGAKLLLDMHEIMPEFYMSKFGVGMSRPLIKILKLLEKISIRFADAVIVINEPIKRLLLQRCKPKSDITVVMNCADDSLFTPDRLACSTEPDSLVLMYHGTLTPLYGLELAIQAVAKLKDRIPHLKFSIFGTESEAGDLKRLAVELGVSRNVIFMGRVSREEIPEYIRQADVGVLPTIRDVFIDLSFSNKLAEYVSMKKPVVATRLKSTLEYFPEDSISYFESRNVEELAAKILDLYASPEKRLLQAETAFQHYQKIRWDIMRRRYIKLINSLISQ
jgi:glycosyltransferase involved in cell wall biosynthesis